MKHHLLIETEPPPEGQSDHAPKEFYSKKQIGNVFELLVTSMRTNLKDPGVLMWCGRKIRTITFTQEEEDDGVSAASAVVQTESPAVATTSDVGEGDESGKGPRRPARVPGDESEGG